jgi:hypothetical protein
LTIDVEELRKMKGDKVPLNGNKFDIHDFSKMNDGTSSDQIDELKE